MGKRAAKTLLDDGDGDLDIRVNEDYARRFEHNKRREEWHKLEERNPALAARLQRKAEADAIKALSRSSAQLNGEGEEEEDEDEDSSEDEEPDPLELAADTDKVLETLLRIRRQDPLIYQKDVRFFPEEEGQGEEADGEEEEDEEEGARKPKRDDKPMYLRTVLAQQALAGNGQEASGSSSDEEGGGDDRRPGLHPRSYVAEQDELKKAFLEAADEVAGGSDGEQEKAAPDALGGVLRKRKRAAAAGEEGGDQEQQVTKLLDEVFGRDESKMDEADRFLKAFIANKAWVDPSDGGGHLPTYGEVVGEEEEEQGQPLDAAALEEDEQFLEEADRYEAQYNFRFEEPGADRIITHPRIIGDSVRKADEKRRRQRESKAARKAAEKEELEAQLKRLKNMKKQEIEDKLREVHKVAGLNVDESDAPAAAAAAGGKAKAKGGSSSGMPDKQLLAELMADDFDPEEYDRRMAAAFDDAYYDMEDDEDVLFGDGEEQLAALSDLEVSGEEEEEQEDAAGQPVGWRALRAKLQQEGQQEEQEQGDSSSSEGEEEGEEGDDKEARRAAMAEKRSQLQRLVEEYYKLDYEDNISGIPCRFRYKEVPKTSYLSPQEILLLDDKELNQIMSLKKLAPYRDDAAKVRPNYKALQAAKGSLPSQPMWKKQKALKQQQQQQQQQQQRVRPAWQVERQEDGSQPQNGQVEGDQEQPQQQDGGDGGQQQQQQQRLQGWKQHSSKHHHHHQQQQRPHGGHSGKHGSHHSKHHKQQQQRLDPAAKQQARVESYAKLSLKRDRPSGDHQQQQHTGTWQQRPQKKQKKEAPPLPEGRLAKVAVDVSGLTPAQKKNLKRALKRKEAKGQA